MQQPTPGPVWRFLGRILVPLYYPHYRRLLIRRYVLEARLELLCLFFTVVAPFATPGLIQLVRRWLDDLRQDVAEFGRVVRAPPAHVAIPSVPATPRVTGEGGFQNPWT
jgi:hypothetical protein